MKSFDEPVKYLMVSRMTIYLDIFGAFMKSRTVGKKDCILVITIRGHDTLYLKTKLMKK